MDNNDLEAVFHRPMWSDGAMFYRRRVPCADKESGTCPSGTDKPPRKATFNATLRWETVSEQVRHRLPDAPPLT